MPRRDIQPVAAAGDHLKTLEALRDRIAEQLDATESARDVASLSARLVEVLDKIGQAKSQAGGQGGDSPLAAVLELVAGQSGAKSPRRTSKPRKRPT